MAKTRLRFELYLTIEEDWEDSGYGEDKVNAITNALSSLLRVSGYSNASLEYVEWESVEEE